MRQFILLSLVFTISGSPALAEWRSTEDLNRAWDKMVKPGEIQTPGTIQDAGPIQQAGPMQQVPYVTGEKAIHEKTADCNRHFTVGSDCLFKFAESNLTKDAEETLKVLGPKLQKLQTHPISIEGHTDSIDTDEKNQILSEKRAARVRNWLLENHYIPLCSKTVGYGEKKPVAPNNKPDGKDYPEGRALNRRVEIVIDTCTALTPEQMNTPPGADAPATASTVNGESASARIDTGVGGMAAPPTVNLQQLLPFSDLFTSEEIHKGFNRLNATPFNDASLSYEVLAPTDWTENPPSVSKEQLAQDSTEQIPIGKFCPKGADDVAVEIRYIKASDDSSLGSFIRAFAEKRGYEIVGRQPGEFNGRQVEDALLKSTDKTTPPVFTRLTVSHHNGKIFVVASSCPEQNYDQWKKVFGAAAVSFNAKGN